LLIVHFLPGQLSILLSVLRKGGHLLFETMGGQGGNYLRLPHIGEMRTLLEHDFRLLYYREKRVGPCWANAVTVRLIARKK
jgi:hypothetical protein